MQVFISSTYKDLIEERQAAVEAVLKADHIPAGMELFKAGDESQLTVIKNWIDQSDIYMLIVGGRYGSIEPKSGLSYTHLEFKMAIESGIPMFVIILKEEMTSRKILSTDNLLKSVDVFETKLKIKKLHKKFVDEVAGDNRIVSFVDNIDHLKAEIFVSLNNVIKTKNLTGWVRADDSQLISENLELKKINKALNEEINFLKNKSTNVYSSVTEAVILQQPTIDNISGGLSMNQIVEYLRHEYLTADLPYDIRIDNNIVSRHPTALEIFVTPSITRKLIKGISKEFTTYNPLDQFLLDELIPVLKRFNLVDVGSSSYAGLYPESYFLNVNGSFLLSNLLNR